MLLLRDIDQPFKFDVNMGSRRFRLEFYDTSCPDNWRLLDPNVIVICYDISQRLSLMNMTRHVRRLYSSRLALAWLLSPLPSPLPPSTRPAVPAGATDWRAVARRGQKGL